MKVVPGAHFVIPAKAGIQNREVRANAIGAGNPWIPAFAGMTVATRKISKNVVLTLALV